MYHATEELILSVTRHNQDTIFSTSEGGQNWRALANVKLGSSHRICQNQKSTKANQVPTMKRSATHQSSDRGPQPQKSAPNNQPTSSNRSTSS